MNINIRVAAESATREDIEVVIYAAWPGAVIKELKEFCEARFAPNGERKSAGARNNEDVFVAEVDGKIVGYLHFFTETWDNYEDHIIARAEDPSLSTAEAAEVRGALELLLREHPL
ncbi:MAG TPA: hypothetical protein VJB98_00185 [Candidatus Paceibacterota bacterium]